MTVFLQIFVLAAVCYVGMFARAQLRRSLRRWRRRQAWRQLDTLPPRGHGRTPAQPG